MNVSTCRQPVPQLIFVMILMVSLQVSAAGFGKRLNIHGQNMPLKQVFDEIKKQTGYIFMVDDALLEKSTAVTIYASDATVTEVLTECMKDQPVTFKIVHKTVFIMEKWVVILMGHKDPLKARSVEGNALLKQDILQPPFLPGLDLYVAREHKK